MPNLFNAIFIRLEGFSKNIIKEFYLVALQSRLYDVFETLQQISPPADLIRLAFLAKSPERVINLLWQNLEEPGKPYALRELLKGLTVSEEGIDIEKLSDPFKTYYKQNSNIIFTNSEEKKLDQFHEIPLSDLLSPAESYNLSQLSTLVTEKKFS